MALLQAEIDTQRQIIKLLRNELPDMKKDRTLGAAGLTGFVDQLRLTSQPPRGPDRLRHLSSNSNTFPAALTQSSGRRMRRGPLLSGRAPRLYFPPDPPAPPAPPPAWLPILLVLDPPPVGCRPMLSPAWFFILEAPVVVFFLPADEGPTSPCPEAPGAGWLDCAYAPVVASAKMQAEAIAIFFMNVVSLWFPSLPTTT
ncbi:hypothetical protein [Bradyrhizobium japonicum]|uniref:hypothetical protein n=1 Tax=Bradyrhizobium japonicum TaxID=375 RepID=UPI003397D945